MVTDIYDLAVVGGGISGLGFAHLAHKRGEKILVLEASDGPGGCIHTHCFNTPDGPFWAELGAHTCYNSYGNLLGMLEETDQLDSLQPKQKLRFQIQTQDGLKSIPSQLNLFELLGVVPRLLLAKKAGRSAGDYFGRVIGRRNYQRVLGPALDAVACQPASDLPADALFRKKTRRKEIMRSYTGPQGLSSFIEGITARSGFDLKANSRVEAIECTPGGFRLHLAGSDAVEAARLVLAVAPDVARQLCHPVWPAIAELLHGIEMSELESRAVLLKSEATALPPLAGIIGRDDDFYSVVSRDLVPDERYRAFTFHFRAGKLDDAGKIRRICAVLGIAEQDILDSIEVNNRLPALRLGHAERIARLDQALQGEPLALTGNWFAGLSIEDCLIRTAQEFTRLYG